MLPAILSPSWFPACGLDHTYCGSSSLSCCMLTTLNLSLANANWNYSLEEVIEPFRQSSQFTKKNENTYYIPVPGSKVVPIFSRRTIYICNYLELWEVFFSRYIVFILLWLTWRLPAPHCIFGSFLTQGLQGFRKQEEISLNVCYNFVIFKSFKQLLLYNIFCVYQDRFEVALVL